MHGKCSPDSRAAAMYLFTNDKTKILVGVRYNIVQIIVWSISHT